MKQTLNKNGVLPGPEEDARTVADCVAKGSPIPEDVVKRVQERGNQARNELLATRGVQDIGVQIIREIRGELPNP